MDVCSIMRSDVPTVTERASIREVVDLLLASKISGLPIVDESGSLAGVVTEHDVIKALMPGYSEVISDEATRPDFDFLLESRAKEIREHPVSSVMIRNVIALSANDSIMKAATTMLVQRIKVLPVVDGEKPIGIVGRIDVVHALIS